MMGKSNFMVFSQRSLSAPGAKSIQNHRVQTTFSLQNNIFFRRNGNNSGSFTKLHFFAYLDVAGMRLYYFILPNIVELRTPAMPVGVGGGKERGGFHLN